MIVTITAIDSRGVDTQPLRDATPIWGFFFSCFMVRRSTQHAVPTIHSDAACERVGCWETVEGVSCSTQRGYWPLPSRTLCSYSM
jgi:hypothetical protein